MKLGTKSVLYGAHAFWLHPFFVAAGWWKLYGFPWDPRLLCAFFLHDLGYIGCENMDGPEGEKHPELGAVIMGALFDKWWDHSAQLTWHNFTLYHSRYYAKKHGAQYSRLCVADKMCIVLTPAWLYLPMVTATGEIREYMANATATPKDHKAVSAEERKNLTSGDKLRWYRGLQDYMRRWCEEHRDLKQDTWTASGVGK